MAGYFETMVIETSQKKDGPIKAGLNRVLDAHRTLKIEGKKIFDNKDLTGEGKAKSALEYLKKNAHELVRARKLVERATTRLAEKRANIKLPEIDKSDAAGALMAGEMRSHLRAMSAPERKAFLAVASLPYLQAALAAPNELTGIDNEVRQAAQTRAIEATNPAKLAELNDEHETIRLLNGAASMLAEDAREMTRIPNDTALNLVLSESVPDTRHIEADIERTL